MGGTPHPGAVSRFSNSYAKKGFFFNPLKKGLKINIQSQCLEGIIEKIYSSRTGGGELSRKRSSRRRARRVRKEVGGAAVNELGLEEGEGVERSPARWGGQGGGPVAELDLEF